VTANAEKAANDVKSRVVKTGGVSNFDFSIFPSQQML
jgi:hypothetical protein